MLDISLSMLASVFKGLSDETRLKILYLLKRRPLCVCEIMGALDITQTKTSRHLIYLKHAGLLEASKEDRWMLYQIRGDLPPEIKEVVDKTVSMLKEMKGIERIEKRLRVILENESLYRQTFGISGRDKGNTPEVLESTPDM